MKNVQILEKSGSFWVFSSIMNDFCLFYKQKGALKTRVFGAQTALLWPYNRAYKGPFFSKNCIFWHFLANLPKFLGNADDRGGVTPDFWGFFEKTKGVPREK